MSVNVQSMLDELREEMTSFEGSLPEISDRDALDGLLGIKHALFDRWKVQDSQAQAQWNAQERKAVAAMPPRSDAPWFDAKSQPPIPSLLGNKARIDEDPVFLIDEVQAYVQEQIDAAHGRFSEIRMQFEKAVMYPRAKAETALVTLRERRQDAQNRQFPDEEQILAQIDKYIAECERLLNPSFDEEHVAKQLRDTGEQLQALYKYPAQLEQVKAAYQSQADFVADLDDVGVDIDAIQSSRSTTMMAVSSQLRDLRGEIGVTNRLLEGFGGYLAAQPELQEALSTGGRVVEALEGDPG